MLLSITVQVNVSHSASSRKQYSQFHPYPNNTTILQLFDENFTTNCFHRDKFIIYTSVKQSSTYCTTLSLFYNFFKQNLWSITDIILHHGSKFSYHYYNGTFHCQCWYLNNLLLWSLGNWQKLTAWDIYTDNMASSHERQKRRSHNIIIIIDTSGKETSFCDNTQEETIIFPLLYSNNRCHNINRQRQQQV